MNKKLIEMGIIAFLYVVIMATSLFVAVLLKSYFENKSTSAIDNTSFVCYANVN